MMDDLISRRDAINAVSEITTTMSVCTNKDECYGMKRMQKQAITELANLPSAKSYGDMVSRNTIIQKLNEMDRYVSTELRLCDTNKKFPQNEVFIVDDVYEEIVEQLPSVQPDVICCKDCKWYGRADKRRFYRGMDCLQKRIDTIVPDRDFCSRAERREDG